MITYYELGGQRKLHEVVVAGTHDAGITGGALDSREGDPGPILLQGDHGPVEFRKLTLTPAK